MAKNIGVIYKIRKYLNLSSLKTLYYSLIYPYLQHCNLAWGNTSQIHLNPLFILQKRAVRTICNVGFLHHTNELFYRHKILKLKDIYLFKLGVHMFNINKSQFERQHDHFTRHRNSLLPSSIRTTTSQRSLNFCGPTF